MPIYVKHTLPTDCQQICNQLTFAHFTAAKLIKKMQINKFNPHFFYFFRIFLIIKQKNTPLEVSFCSPSWT